MTQNGLNGALRRNSAQLLSEKARISREDVPVCAELHRFGRKDRALDLTPIEREGTPR
jgi:hypothetical protein